MLKVVVAVRYIFSRKSHSIINLLSVISVIAVAVPVAAAVFIVCLHNGLSQQIYSLYNQFDPDVKITAKNSLFFNPNEVGLAQFDFVDQASLSLEQGVMLECGGNQVVAILKGVDSNYQKVVEVDKLITHGEFRLALGDLKEIVLGQGVAYNLGINPALKQNIVLYSLNTSPFIQMPIFAVQNALASGVFAMDKQTDEKYLFASMELAKELLGKQNEVSSIEVKLKNGVSHSEAASLIKAKIGERFEVKTKAQQRDSIFKVINIEKWITMLLLTLIVFIAALSLVGAIVIMIAEKKRQNKTLLVLGYKPKDIKNIYNLLGGIISLVGVVVGIGVGLAMVGVQMKWGVLSMGGGFLIDAYAVKIVILDILAIFFAIMLITAVITYVTTKVVKIEIE